MKNLEKILKALANNRRLMILKYLKFHKEASVGEIAEGIKLSLKATSKHLHILLIVDIVERSQRKFEAFYKIADNLHPIAKHIIFNF